MKDFRPSLAYFLIVLGQLCLNSEVEINLNVDMLTVSDSDTKQPTATLRLESS